MKDHKPNNDFGTAAHDKASAKTCLCMLICLHKKSRMGGQEWQHQVLRGKQVLTEMRLPVCLNN